MTTRFVLSLCVASLLLVGTAFSQTVDPFPSAFLPDGPRPRLWLTGDRLAILQAARTANTDEWQRFQADAITYLGEEPWNGPQYAIPHMLLMYELTDDDAYGQKAIDYMVATRTIPMGGNDPAHGAYHTIALGYDWMHDSPLMTPELRATFIARMIAWSDHVWATDNASGIGGNPADTDHIIMTGAVHLMMGCAIQGESPQAQTLLDRAWWLWIRGQGAEMPEPGGQPQSVRDWVLKSIGGNFQTGFSYFSGTDAVGLMQYWLTLKTACNYDVIVQEPQLARFWPNVSRTLADMTDPTLTFIHHSGDWEEPSTLDIQPWICQVATFAQYLSLDAGDANMAALAQWYYESINSINNATFNEFFFSNPSLAPQSPTQLGIDPLRFCNGPDWLFFRSDWTSTATWGMFLGDGSLPVDHQGPDHGHFSLWRENDYLTKDARAYIGSPAEAGVFYSNMSIQNASNSGTAAWGDHAGPASIDRVLLSQSSPQFAYAMLNADEQWDQHPDVWEAVSRVDSYRRHFFWSGEYVFIFDRLRTSDSGWAAYRIRALTQPVVNGTEFTSTSSNGMQRLYHRTLEPAGATISVIDETGAWNGVYQDWEVALDERRWQVEVRPTDGTGSNFLNVLQSGPASLAGFDQLDHLTGAGYTGARLGNWAVTYNSDEATRNAISYTITNPGESMNHLATDVQPGVYNLFFDEQASGQIVVDSQSMAAFFQTSSAPAAPTLAVRLEYAGGALPPSVNSILVR